MQFFLFFKQLMENIYKEVTAQRRHKKFTGHSHHCDCPAT